MGVGFAVGFRIHRSLIDALAAFALCVAFGFAFEWFFILLGLMAGTPQAAQLTAGVISLAPPTHVALPHSGRFVRRGP